MSPARTPRRCAGSRPPAPSCWARPTRRSSPPAPFCGIVGIRPTPGLTPNYPGALAWDPGQVNGPLARSAEDAALMLDAMVGFSRLSPISVAPPWASAREIVAAAEDAKGLRVAYVSDI